MDDDQLDRLLEDYWLAWVNSEDAEVSPELDARILAAIANTPMPGQTPKRT